MHLGNGIICPSTGIPMLVLAGATAFYAFKNAKKDFSKDKIIIASALTAFVFAVQMLNFSIPITSSSGHIIGGVLLSAVLGPYAAFLAMCSILSVQSVFFADGGLLALGCNIFNMGFIACFIAYPFLYKPLAKKNKSTLGAIIACIAALQFASLAVVAESVISDSISISNAGTFAALMQFIHLPIGIIEGILTAAIIFAVKKSSTKNISMLFSGISLAIAGFIAQYASQKPDGLEWALLKMSDNVIMQTQNSIYAFAEFLQAKTAIFADMTFVAANIAGLLTVVAVILALSFLSHGKSIKIDVEK